MHEGLFRTRTILHPRDMHSFIYIVVMTGEQLTKIVHVR